MQTLSQLQANSSERVERALKIAADAVSNSGGNNIFRELVLKIIEALNVKYAYIGEVCPHNSEMVNIIAGHFDKGFIENFEFDLDGTPCKNVVNQSYQYYPRNVSNMFSGDTMAKNMGVEGYAAIPLYDSRGYGMGLMVVMHTESLTEPELTKSLLQIFSVRAAIELEKIRVTAINRATEEQYRTIFNKSVDGLILFSFDGKIVDVNPAWIAMHGYSREEVLASRPQHFVPPESRDTFRDFIATVSKHKPFHTVANTLRKDGSRYLADVRGVIMDYQGEPHLLAIFRDVTAQVEHETALRKSEDRLRSTIDAAMDCIIGIDADGKVLEFNPAAEETFGYKKVEIVGKPLADLIIPERYRAQHTNALLQRKRHGGGTVARRREITGMRSDGSEFPVELSIDVAQGEDGEIYIGYLRDITERQLAEEQRTRLEAQLRQSQKMEAIGHLSGGIAHDFNNILTGIMGYIVLASEKSEPYADDKMQKYLTRAMRSGQKARDLIQQMLTFSRGQRGEPKPITLTPLVKESIKLLESTLPSTIEIKTNCDNSLPRVNVDPVHIEQIIMNLCINARDAMQGHGELTILLNQRHCSDCICASCQQSIGGTYLELAVSDSGIGIPQEKITRIFEPFYSTKDVGKGSGMGLSTVHGIVHEYGGHIGVNTEAGEGSTFRIFLPPIAQSSGEQYPEPNTSSASTSAARKLSGRVALVDDETTVSEFMEDMLENWGMDVYTFNSALEAKDFIEANPHAFDLIILDQTMPKMPGIELASHIVSTNPDIPIILYTGYSENICNDDLERLGIRKLVKKPIDVDEFYQLTSAILHDAS
jgi:PAS domain S-box-containing protein